MFRILSVLVKPVTCDLCFVPAVSAEMSLQAFCPAVLVNSKQDFSLLCYRSSFWSIDHFTVVCSVTWPLHGSEAGGDLALIQTSRCLSCKCTYLALEQLDLHNKSNEVCIKTRSTPASLPFKGQVTEETTVKWSICLWCRYVNFPLCTTPWVTWKRSVYVFLFTWLAKKRFSSGAQHQGQAGNFQTSIRTWAGKISEQICLHQVCYR